MWPRCLPSEALVPALTAKLLRNQIHSIRAPFLINNLHHDYYEVWTAFEFRCCLGMAMLKTRNMTISYVPSKNNCTTTYYTRYMRPCTHRWKSRWKIWSKMMNLPKQGELINMVEEQPLIWKWSLNIVLRTFWWMAFNQTNSFSWKIPFEILKDILLYVIQRKFHSMSNIKSIHQHWQMCNLFQHWQGTIYKFL